jgi:hypothetical protein
MWFATSTCLKAIAGCLGRTVEDVRGDLAALVEVGSIQLGQVPQAGAHRRLLG